MAPSELRYRGVRPEVDTTEAAELDILDLGVSYPLLVRIALNLKALPVSTADRLAGNIRIREIEGLDVLFHIQLQERVQVIMICGLRRPTPEDPTEALLNRLGPLAILRGATGL